MTDLERLRDELAAAAITGILADPSISCTHEQAADQAYLQADALLVRRQKDIPAPVTAPVLIEEMLQHLKDYTLGIDCTCAKTEPRCLFCRSCATVKKFQERPTAPGGAGTPIEVLGVLETLVSQYVYEDGLPHAVQRLPWEDVDPVWRKAALLVRGRQAR